MYTWEPVEPVVLCVAGRLPRPAARRLRGDVRRGAPDAGSDGACPKTGAKGPPRLTLSVHRQMVTFRGCCELSSRNVFLTSSSSDVGCTLPSTSVTRETRVCSPGVAPFQV